jgi:flagellar hook-length control protein FliK
MQTMVTDFTTPASAPTTTPATPSTSAPSATDAQAGGDFVAALADALNVEASSAAATTPLAAVVATKEDDLERGEDLLDAGAMFIDPQALILSLEQPSRVDTAAPSPTSGGPRALDAQANRAMATAMIAAAPVLSAESKDANSLFDATAKAGRDAREVLLDTKSDIKPTGDAANANVLATNAAAHERISELREQPVIRAHVGTSTWTEELAGKLTVMVGRGLQSASLRLSPEHLGPLEIRISIQNEQTSVWFGAAHADTRAALEQALPRLRELMAGQGLNLSDAGVFRETPRQPNKQYAGSQFASPDGERETTFTAVRLRGIVDAYA